MVGGGELHQMFGSRVQHVIKNWTQSDLGFCENEGSERSKINKKKEVSWIENQGQINTKCLKIVNCFHILVKN